MSFGDLATATGSGRGWINNVESGRRWPTDRRWVVLADEKLAAAGELVAAWDRAKSEREDRNAVRKLLADSVAEARQILSVPDLADLDQLHVEAAQLNIDYLSKPPAPMLSRALEVQREAVRRMHEHAYKGADLHDLNIIAGRATAVLSYAALDLGDSAAASIHARTVFSLGERAQDDALRAWARGTQSLIARFDRRYTEAAAFIGNGLQYATVGTAGARLLAGGAQCAANLGNAEEAIRLLDKAAKAHDGAKPDEVGGLLGFSPAKLRYYGGSALMWLDDRSALKRAEQDAAAAIHMWEHGLVEQRPQDDEALAHVYLARARIRLGDIEAGMEAVQPVLALPQDRVISWIRKRVADLAAGLDDATFPGSTVAREAREDLLAFGA